MQRTAAVYCLSSQKLLSHISKAVQSPLASTDAPGDGVSVGECLFFWSCLLSLGVTGCIHTTQRRRQADPHTAAQSCWLLLRHGGVSMLLLWLSTLLVTCHAAAGQSVYAEVYARVLSC